MSDKIGHVVIGYGGMGGWHVEHALKSDVVELKGIFDIKPERAELARSRGIFAYDSLDAVLADPAVRLVTVAIPNDSHKETVIRALEAGKNVICEKPVALSVADFDDMVAAAKKNGVLFTVHQNRRWDVDYLAMQQIIDSGEIGRPLNIESRIHGSRGIPSDWRGEKEHGGGMLYDWGVHTIDQMMLLRRDTEIDSLFCRFTHITNQEVDDGFRLHLYYKDGTTSYLEVGTYNFIALPRFYMQCEKGTAVITDWREKTQVVKCKAWHENDVLPVKTAAGLTKTMAPRDSVTTDTYEVERPASDVHDFYRNVCAAIRGEADQIVTHAQLRLVLRVIAAAFESDRTGQVVKFD